MIQFFNTLSGEKEPFAPLVPGEVKLYTCGPTVYDFSHIGNLRAYVFEDLLKRFLQFRGFRVAHVMNITDVDDKTIRGANAQSVSLNEYTKPYIEAFFKDLNVLNISPADHYPRATEHIAEMVRIIKALLEKGIAYRTDASIYFSIAKFPGYGKLSKINLDQLRSTKRVESDEYEKESAQDFALWKAPKEGEPYWDTEIGPGRPGWHIECSAMSSKFLGPTFDIHCGGVDNIFPHHENEIAQSETYFGKPVVNYWLHCHHLIVNGEKMSKSKGNYFTLRDLVQKRQVKPMALRFLLLSTHYRKVLNFTFEALEQAEAAWQRIKDFLYELEHHAFPSGKNSDSQKLLEETNDRFVEGLSDDLNISVALTALFELIKKTNVLIKDGKICADDAKDTVSFVYSLDRVFALLPSKKDMDLADELRPKIQEREQARKERNFKRADEIRKELLEAGIILEDTKDGVRWKILEKRG
ncbi:MAG: cysteine--tRNA ligase [Candidatus Aminicenantes bacterium]|nr:cysteine--tRNA ligase [Candidatus Aminicenantes bacterium]